MSRRFQRAAAAVAALLAACASTDDDDGRARLQPAYSGETSGGQALRLALHESPGGWVGTGELDGEPFVFLEREAEAVRGVAVLADGRQEPVVLRPLQSGQLVLEWQAERFVFDPGGEIPPGNGGPFQGVYGSEALLAVERLELVQQAERVSGHALCFGRPLVLTATRVAADRFEGSLDAEGGFTVQVQGTLTTPDLLELTGFGAPVRLERR